MKRARAFTLLEVAVAIALMGVVIGAALAMLDAVENGGRRARAHSEMMRDAAFASQLMSNDLRQAGLGVPRAFTDACAETGFNIRHDCGSPGPGTTVPCAFSYGLDATGNAPGSASAGANFYSSVVLANDTQVGIVGDLARVDGQYSAFGPLHNRATGGLPGADDSSSADKIMWHNENNGSCAPGNGCSTASTSLFFGGETTELCDSGGANNDRTCPWGMRRVLPGERIQIVAGDAGWSTAALANPLNVTTPNSPVPPDGAGSSHFAISLNPGFDAELSSGGPPAGADTVWRNQVRGEGPGGISGQGWVTTLDRVFYFFDAATNTLNRIQCSGDPDPNNPRWPNRAAATLPAGAAAFLAAVQMTPTAPASPMAAGDVAPNFCVGPDVVARNVKSVAFTYFDGAGNGLTTPVTGQATPNPATCTPATGPATLDTASPGKNSVRRIDFVITFEKHAELTGAAVPQIVTHVVRGSVRLLNLQGV